MATAREWSLWIKIFSACIIIGGVFSIISSFVNEGGIAFNWASFVLGIFYIMVGIRGFHAGLHYSAKDARQYYRGIITIIIMLIVLNIVGIIVNQVSRTDEYCREYNDRNPTNRISCHDFKKALLAAGLVSLFASVTCCSACAYCARAYYHELIHEEQGYYYTSPPVTSAYQYGAPPPYPATGPTPYYSHPPTTHHTGYQQI